MVLRQGIEGMQIRIACMAFSHVPVARCAQRLSDESARCIRVLYLYLLMILKHESESEIGTSRAERRVDRAARDHICSLTGPPTAATLWLRVILCEIQSRCSCAWRDHRGEVRMESRWFAPLLSRFWTVSRPTALLRLLRFRRAPENSARKSSFSPSTDIRCTPAALTVFWFSIMAKAKIEKKKKIE